MTQRGPLKLGFGLSGAVLSLDVSCCGSLSSSRHDYVPVNLKPHRTRSKADSKIRRLPSVVNNRRRW